MGCNDCHRDNHDRDYHRDGHHDDYDQVCGVECAKGARHRVECKLLAGQEEPNYAPVITIIIITISIIIILTLMDYDDFYDGYYDKIVPGHTFANAAAPGGRWRSLAQVVCHHSDMRC